MADILGVEREGLSIDLRQNVLTLQGGVNHRAIPRESFLIGTTVKGMISGGLAFWRQSITPG